MTRRWLSRRAVRTGALVATSCLFGFLPFSCTQPILRLATPILIDGGNPLLQGAIKLLAPLLLR